MKEAVSKWFKIIAWGSAFFLIIGGFVLAFFTANDMRELPDDLAVLTNASIKPQLLDREGNALTITYSNRWNAHDRKSLHQIPPFLKRAFVLAEDKRFHEHTGVDWAARLNAVVQNMLALKGVRGASTISEQVVRMIHQRPRSFWSRWVEGWEAQKLEAKFDKTTILEFYLNQVPYAAQRRGVQQAARYYFDRDVTTLSEKEMLALAVLVRAPSRFDLYKSTERIEGRLNTLLDRAVATGLVEDQAQVTSEVLQVQRSQPLLDVSHFASHIYSRANTNTHQIKTTLNSNYQNLAQELLNERLASLRKRHVQNAAMLVLDHQTDEILVWAVGNNESQEGSAYDTVLVKRQPGSTLKPFVYASALEKGWSAATMIDDSPLQEGVGRGVHRYRNYSNTFHGRVSLRTALGNSLNIPAIKAAQYVGVEPLMDKLNKLGIHDLSLRSVDYGNGIALGNGEISLYSLVGAYATLARQGIYRPMKTRASREMTNGASVFSAEISSIIGNILADSDARALEFGRGGTLHLPVQTAVKTGTSNDYRDAWVVGYNHRYVVGVWMGNLNNEPMDKVTGAAGPALVLRSMFAELSRNSKTEPLFISRKLVSHTVCIDSGLVANNGCATRREWFRPENSPQTKPIEAEANSYAIAQPIDQMLVARDPRIPDESEALEFKLNDDDGVRKVDWFLNDKLIASTASANYFWPLQDGEHVVMARVFSEEGTEPFTTQRVSMIVK